MDIFDKIMHLPGLRVLEPFYKKHKEFLLYAFFGGLTFLVSIFSYAFFNVTIGINELLANVDSWLFAVLFAFLTNRLWVFDSRTEGKRAFLLQMVSFFGGRLITLVVEEAILFVFITLLAFKSMPVKIAAQILVILLNYIISKRIIFRDSSRS